MSYTPRAVGTRHTTGYRVYLENAEGRVVSPFHDVPLHAEGSTPEAPVLNMIVEIPRWTNAKLEMATDEPFNPIKQDTKKGKLRFVRNCFPHHGYIWNYGALPQTWEDPGATHPDTKACGDKDPLDVCEIGEAIGYTGQVKQVKVLGVMALLDEGETDWKVLVIDVKDPIADKLNDIEDVERHMPGLIRATNEWFRIYKIPDGKPENTFAFSGEAKNKKYALEVIRETHEAWRKLVQGQTPASGDGYQLSLVNATVEESVSCVSPEDEVARGVPAAQDGGEEPLEQSVHKWFYISGANL